MRIATWNVNGLRARLDYVLAWLRDRKPDIVALQELKLTAEQFPRDLLEAEGYRAVVRGQKAWNGVAILSREPIAITQEGLPGQEAMGARLVSAAVGDLTITSVYCPNGKHVGHEDFQRKLEWFDALLEHLRNRHAPGAAQIVTGDFNVCPGALDSWNEEALRGTIFHTSEERTRLRALIDWGLHDLFRELNPQARAFSWWDYRGGAFHRGQGLRIDLLLATHGVRDRVHSVTIDRDYRKKKDGLTPSDHAPVFADIDTSS
ncbi:MAG: exodeoxyribonuclease III [Acidobacteriota bacterium]